MSEYDGSIDELLTSQTSTQTPDAPEMKPDLYGEPDESPESIEDHEEEQESFPEKDYIDPNEDEQEEEKPKAELDDYGNEKPAPRTYTEEEVNERINRAVRERMSRGQFAEQQQGQQAQQATQAGFQYNEDSSETWEQQLERFVEQTVSKMSEKQTRAMQEARERQIQAEFEGKFQQGMDRFSDFREVVSQQPITDAMTIALRGINDPSAFIYAASKRHGAELQRIANLPDQYSQIVEMGKLEERMRKTPPTTKAPRPVNRTKEDAGMKTSAKRSEPSIEELIKKSEAKKIAAIKQRRSR